LPDYLDPVPPDDQYPCTLVSGKELPFFHSSLRNIPRLRKLAPKPTVRIHPELASARDLKEGDTAAIATELGEIRQIVKLQLHSWGPKRVSRGRWHLRKP
jgi:anaerobic selenocysteine-containing dehydrogenase